MSVVKVVVLRTLSEEEQVRFESECADNDVAITIADAQLACVRRHMIALNEQVRAIDEAKAKELGDAITAKGEELKRLEREIDAKREEASKLDKKLRRVS